jgi:hypothetical protein
MAKKVYSAEELYNKTVSELREMCVKFGITGMSKRRKDEIVDALCDYYEDTAPEPQVKTPVSSSSIVSMNAQLSSYRNPDSKNDDDKYITKILETSQLLERKLEQLLNS